MRVLLNAAAVLACLLVAVSSAVAATSPDKASGSFTCSAGSNLGTVEFVCFEAFGVPGTSGYEPAEGTLTMSSADADYDFTLSVDDASIDVDGFALMSGRDDSGRKWVVLAADGGNPGVGNDTFWTIRYDEDDVFVEVIGWSLTSGNLKVHAEQ